MQTATAIHDTPARRSMTLDDLASRSFAELEAMYRAAIVPSKLSAVDGKLVGRMLRVRGLPGGVADALRRFAGSRSFPWGGKTFEARGEHAGSGINRVNLPGVLGRQNLFPFATRFEASALDGRPTIVLDYDKPENPPYIRKVHDEIREVAPGLFLGPAMWKGASGPMTVLWFALDARRA
jgi:hypothetical protein